MVTNLIAWLKINSWRKKSHGMMYHFWILLVHSKHYFINWNNKSIIWLGFFFCLRVWGSIFIVQMSDILLKVVKFEWLSDRNAKSALPIIIKRNNTRPIFTFSLSLPLPVSYTHTLSLSLLYTHTHCLLHTNTIFISLAYTHTPSFSL